MPALSPIASEIPLRPYQQAAIEQVLIAGQQPHGGLLVVLPTGAGKTITFGALARTVGARTLILAHRDELLAQTLDKVAAVWPEVSVGRVQGRANDVAAHVVAASVQTLRQSVRLAQYLAAGAPRLIVVDEAHHAVSASYRTILAALSQANPYRMLVGVTATPQRGDGVSLAPIFDRVVYQRSLWDMVREGWLVDLRGFRIAVPITATQWGQMRTVHGDYADADVERLMNVGPVNAALVSAWREKAGDRPTVVFAASIAHAETLAATFRHHQIATTVVHGQLAKAERRLRLDHFHRGLYQVIVSVAVLTEGWDEPAIGCVVMARPTRSPALYLQCIGRGARTYPNKYDCIILDVTPEAAAPDLCHLGSVLAGKPLPDGTSIRQSLLATTASAAPSGAPMPPSRDLGADDSAPPAAFDPFLASRLQWQQVAGRDDRPWWFVREEMDTLLWLVPRLTGYPAHDTSWIVTARRVRAAGHPPHWVFAVRERPVLSAYAQGIIEGSVRSALASRKAAWRLHPATEKQRTELARRRIATGPALTKGAATDLLDQLERPRYRHALQAWLASPEGQRVD